MELDDLGFALAIPSTWVIEEPSSHPFDLWVKNPARLEECWLVVDAASSYAGETLTDKAPAFATAVQRIQERADVPEWISLVLPGGNAVRVDDGSQWHDSFTYLWLHGEDLPALTCQGLDPGDQWMSIAESVQLITAVEPTSAPTPPPTPIATTLERDADAVIERVHEPAVVKITKPGSRPRRLLRYDWTEGQRETMSIDIRMNSERSLGVESTGRIEIPTLRMTVTIEVLEIFANGDYLVEQTLTEVGIPIGEAGDPAMAREIEGTLASMIGLQAEARMSDRGVVRRSETRYPVTMDLQIQEIFGSDIDVLSPLLPLLPERRVGIGAVWRVGQEIDSDLGFSAMQRTRTRLQDVIEDTIYIHTTVQQSAPRQRIEAADGADYRATLESHELATDETAAVRLRGLAPQSHSTTTSHARFTARQGQQMETAITDTEYDVTTRPLD